MSKAISKTELPLKLYKSGKVREIFELDAEHLLLVASDRLSAFDYVMHPPIPFKGIVLTKISRFWFEHFSKVPNHIVSFSVDNIPQLKPYKELLKDRVMLVRKSKVIPFEFIFRGYLFGSLFESYEKGEVKDLPKGMKKGAELKSPLFTPTTKAEKGHDLPCTVSDIEKSVGKEVARYVIENSLKCYNEARKKALERNLILADTKFEWGMSKGETILIDEILTPDSSRYWDATQYKNGVLEQFDKQVVRDWLIKSGWDRQSEPPELPPHIVEQTQARYIELLNRLTGEKL
ncbi:MAG: phosphoribosylaminoimidazolesuccinocarboxamide synthase [Planctomycetota bacterium]|nr:phosphoribosylaminoimidazolesuccinocarboxamide synthase [Planctomycetota bacterium]